MKKANKARRRGPSAASLREIPELSNDAIDLGRGAEGLRNAKALLRVKRDRPKKGEQVPGSRPRSIRIPDATWKLLEREVRQRGTTLHALLRDVLENWLKRRRAA